MKKIIKSMDKDFPPIVFGCDFCGAEFVVSPPEEDMRIECVEAPLIEKDNMYYCGHIAIFRNEHFFKTEGVYRAVAYITHCPVCGEKVRWVTVTKR